MMMDSSTQLLESQRQLAAEELCLKKSLAQIEEQINVLQIEQLHLIALLKKSSKGSPKETLGSANTQAGTETKVEELDLDVPIHMKVYLEEGEEEEEEDEDL
ncbi:uncharacterized protein LOC107042721 [Diachasma alloeum]|uniref:uncharacterized protein LOC107042721 n=1 Tax=Diachasma alloeum TaxID=454923 RepID=UPI0007383841|nr:uncharacterized protein LOC107042721 [Diachasma alloeum]